ncbi:MAG: DNA replication and repair protein RecF [Balneolales bacterium]
MNIKHLEAHAFRNHAHVSFDFAPHINLISGPNGVGKTNLIDSMHYLCMSRSFVSGSNVYVVKQGESGFSIKGEFEGRIRKSFEVGCTYDRGEGKKITVNQSPLDRLSDLIGMVPVVVLSPDDKKLTAEGPVERRSFLDSFISQLSKSYLRDLIDYRKIIRQRNRLLSTHGLNKSNLIAYIDPWNEQLIEVGSRIVAKRYAVTKEYSEFLEDGYQLISGMNHHPHFVYKSFCEPSTDTEQIAACFKERLMSVFDRELEREQTLIGPHRDDLVFYLDDQEIRKYGSQGQHRMFALALKLAQLKYFTEKLDDLPLFLLDDVFGDLDPHKTEVFLKMLVEHKGQTFITAANAEPLKKWIPLESDNNMQLEIKQ